MQTFLPYSNFEKCAQVLDNKRLGKQRVEAWQILKIITGEDSNSRWHNHPAVKMWQGYSYSLAQYGLYICKIWTDKGFIDSLTDKFLTHLEGIYFNDIIHPLWLENIQLHSSHRAALLAKNYKHYSQFGWTEEPQIDYYWPVR